MLSPMVLEVWLKRLLAVVVGLSAVLALAACAPAEPEVNEETAVVEEAAEQAAEDPASEEDMAGDSADGGAAGERVEEEASPSVDEDMAEVDEVMPSEEAGDVDMEESAGDGGGIGGGPEAGAPPLEDTEFQASLTAGEIDDNADFSAYLSYRTTYENLVGLGDIPDVDISERYPIAVVTPGGLPVLGAQVLVYDGQDLITSMRTTASGVVYFHPLVFGGLSSEYNITVRKGNAVEEFTLVRGDESPRVITMAADPAEAPVNLDVVFLLDATGSMGDEIAQLKNNIQSISAQVNALPANPNVRFGLVIYRDEGDAFITRTFDFTDDINAFQQILDNVQAAGGGDEPEALDQGLYAALNELQWRIEDTVSLVFLVADAPPHLGQLYDAPMYYDYQMEVAAEMGVVIHPIASSGLSASGEYIFRQIAQYTGGHFIFLTYDSQPQSSGEPGREDVSVPEENFSVEDLDVLVVRLIEEEIAQLFEQQ